MSDSLRYLRPNVALEPLYNQWYAWWYLIPPATAPMFIAHHHLRIMQSFVAAPDIHVAALHNPQLAGGPYINHPAARAGEIRELLERTRREAAPALQMVEALAELDQLLAAQTGHSLEGLYARVPDILRGYVELTYDLHHRASVRLIEPLLYRSPHYREAAQSVVLRRIDRDARPYIFSTPRLEGGGGVHCRVPFRAPGIDALFAMQTTPAAIEPVADALGVAPREREAFDALFTDQPMAVAPRYAGPGVRLRYFGHACLLVESAEVSILTDPVVSYQHATDLPRFTHADLPARIDYVLITHGHADHLMLETLVPLRARIGTIVVPRSGSGALSDPSLKLLLQAVGFRRVVEIEDLDELEIPGGALTGLPFLGEHSDLEIRAKTAHLIRLGGHTLLMAADSNAIEPRLYDHIRAAVGKVDVLFLGMESEGAPMSWMYGALLHTPLPRKMDQSRRLNGSNGERAVEIVRRLGPREVHVYAMGREPWLSHVMAMGYTEESPQLLETRKLFAHCRDAGIATSMPYVRAELVLP
jgi:L-ascorbate metabolism protein UlaG (beta-lactamase superfamily)